MQACLHDMDVVVLQDCRDCHVPGVQVTNTISEHGAYTRSLNITYNRPIRTPQVIVARGVAVGQDGRKILVKGYLEDSKGRVLAEADALWLAMQYNLRETSKL